MNYHQLLVGRLLFRGPNGDTKAMIHKGIIENAFDEVKPRIPLLEAEAGSVVFVLRPHIWWWERLTAVSCAAVAAGPA